MDEDQSTITTPKINTQDIIDEFEGPLSAFIRSRVNSPVDAEDLLQEVWLQLSKNKKLEEVKSISGWLYQVARNKIIDHYRKMSPDLLDDFLWEGDQEEMYGEMYLPATDEDPELILFQDQFWETLYQALEELPEKQREVFVLNELDGFTMREIAEQNDENLKTILSRKRYAVMFLRERLRLMFEEYFG